MKITLVIISIFSFLAKDIASFSWDVWFYLHQQEIASEKCENKAIPMMHCNGKCYLAKQLKKLEQKEQRHQSKTNPFKGIEKTYFLLEIFKYQNTEEVLLNSLKPSFYYAFFFSKVNNREIFRPPIV